MSNDNYSIGSMVEISIRHINDIPNGWIKADGGEITESSYPELYKALKNKEGKAILPNLISANSLFIIKAKDDNE